MFFIGNAHARMDPFSRAQLLARGAKGGAALVLGSGVVGAGPLRGSAAAAAPDADLAYLRLLVGTELLAADFYTQAVAAKKLDGELRRYVNRVLFNETEHYQALSGLLKGAGQTPAAPGDFDFAYPDGTFASKVAIAKLAVSLETTALGAYLGAVANVQTESFKQPFARIAASEAQHLGLVTRMAGGDPVGVSFPDALPVDQVSDALDTFTS